MSQMNNLIYAKFSQIGQGRSQCTSQSLEEAAFGRRGMQMAQPEKAPENSPRVSRLRQRASCHWAGLRLFAWLSPAATRFTVDFHLQMPTSERRRAQAPPSYPGPEPAHSSLVYSLLARRSWWPGLRQTSSGMWFFTGRLLLRKKQICPLWKGTQAFER